MQGRRSATKRWDTASRHGGTDLDSGSRTMAPRHPRFHRARCSPAATRTVETLYQKAEILREFPESGYRYWQRDGGSLVDLLCSRNARPRKDGKGAAGPSFLLAERARSECARPMRAVKDSPTTPLGERVHGVTGKTARGPRWTRTMRDRPGRPLERQRANLEGEHLYFVGRPAIGPGPAYNTTTGSLS